MYPTATNRCRVWDMWWLSLRAWPVKATYVLASWAHISKACCCYIISYKGNMYSLYSLNCLCSGAPCLKGHHWRVSDVQYTWARLVRVYCLDVGGCDCFVIIDLWLDHFCVHAVTARVGSYLASLQPTCRQQIALLKRWVASKRDLECRWWIPHPNRIPTSSHMLPYWLQFCRLCCGSDKDRGVSWRDGLE